MKANTFPSFVPFILKVTGGVLILLYLMDIITLLFGAKFQEYGWILEFTTRLIDRGFIPLLGIASLFTGFWLEGEGDDQANPRSKGLKLTALLLSSLLGLLFLLLVPWHVSTTQVARDEELKRIGDRVKQVETQLNAQVQQQLDGQLAALEQAVKSGQLPAEQSQQAKKQLEQLKKLKSDPKALEAQVGPARTKKLEEVRAEQQKAENQIKDNALKSGLRIGLGGLLLAISYAAIGWTGLRRML
jgi:hypothetical protein